MPFDKRPPEKKLFNKLKKLTLEEVQKDASSHGKYERLRQTFMHEPPNEKLDIYCKIKAEQKITEKDLNRVASEKNVNLISDNDRIYKFYVDKLKSIKERNEQIKKRLESTKPLYKGSLDYDKNQLLEVAKFVEDSVKKQQDMPPEAKEKIERLRLQFSKYASFLKSVVFVFEQTSKNHAEDIRQAEELKNFFYGPNNFYKKGAQDFVKKYKTIYDLASKCDGENFLNVLVANKVSKYEVKSKYVMILNELQSVSMDAYGVDNDYTKNIFKINQELSNI